MIGRRKTAIGAVMIGCWASASHAEPAVVFPFGTYDCVRNPAEENIELAGRVVLADGSHFRLLVQSAPDGASAILEPVPNEQFPRETVRLTRFSVNSVRSAANAEGKATLFIYGEGTSADGRSVSVSDLWVGDSEGALNAFNPRITSGAAVTSVTCYFERQEGLAQ